MDLGSSAVPNATAVAVNLTVPAAGAAGWLSAYPAGSAGAQVSVFDFLAGNSASGAVIRFGADHRVTFANHSGQPADHPLAAVPAIVARHIDGVLSWRHGTACADTADARWQPVSDLIAGTDATAYDYFGSNIGEGWAVVFRTADGVTHQVFMNGVLAHGS